MDLAEILKKTKAKSERVTTTRRPPSIATEDRPYSIADSKLFQPIDDQISNPETNLFNSSIEGMNYPNASIINSENILQNTVGIVKETVNKVVTNRKQTDNKPITNQEQIGNKSQIKSQQPEDNAEHINENHQQSDSITGNNVATIRKQTENKLATNIPFSELVGLQREIIILVCHECKNSRSRTTEALTLEYISVALKRSAGAIKTTIQRLEKKGCLIRMAFKNGRGGWSKYELPDSVYHDVLRSETANKLTANWQQIDNKVMLPPITQPTTSTSSSSILNIKDTFTLLDDEWNFDITPYAKFGFMISQLKQLASLGVISAMDVEQSLIEFNHDLDNNAPPQMNKSKLNFLMGILRKGQCYVSETYRNEEEAIILDMAKRKEEKRKKLLEEKFVVWEGSLNDEERKMIENKFPLPLRVMLRAHGISNSEVKNWLFNYYLQTCLS